MKTKIFELNPGDKFILNNKVFTVVKFVKKFMPTLGRVLNCKTISEDNKIALFISNFEVDLII